MSETISKPSHQHQHQLHHHKDRLKEASTENEIVDVKEVEDEGDHMNSEQQQLADALSSIQQQQKLKKRGSKKRHSKSFVQTSANQQNEHQLDDAQVSLLRRASVLNVLNTDSETGSQSSSRRNIDNEF